VRVKKMSELWRSLKIGDQVRVIAWPLELHTLHPETEEVYRWLIETGNVLTVERFDHLGLPYGVVSRTVDGLRLTESLLLNHGGLQIVTIPV
jgi:hypothetical protein